jgi:hypothetical protein
LLWPFSRLKNTAKTDGQIDGDRAVVRPPNASDKSDFRVEFFSRTDGSGCQLIGNGKFGASPFFGT